jgi:hypothetical protein
MNDEEKIKIPKPRNTKQKLHQVLWYAKNREYVNQWHKDYYARNAEKIRAQRKLRREQKLKDEPKNEPTD